MNTSDILDISQKHLLKFQGTIFDVLSISKPNSFEEACNLIKIISKLSPILGNFIEFRIVEFLNKQQDFKDIGNWRRQDPDFPDAIFESEISPKPGFEIKAWFPLATEITARFKDSQNYFAYDQTDVAMLAWLPEKIIYGRPKVIDIVISTAKSIAKARDDHYHNPPDYLILEPEDTSNRTRNLQQTNTNGYKFQGTAAEFLKAQRMVESWGPDSKTYRPTKDYQKKIRTLIERYKYRLDTNFAKMDRIGHDEIEDFKKRVLNTIYFENKISEWAKIFYKSSEYDLKKILKDILQID